MRKTKVLHLKRLLNKSKVTKTKRAWRVLKKMYNETPRPVRPKLFQ